MGASVAPRSVTWIVSTDGMICRVDIESPFQVSLSGRPYAFVSYAHADAPRVYPLIGQLHHDGFELWYDQGIEPTDAWAGTIPSRIDNSNLFIVFASTVAYSRRGVQMEIDWAVKHGARILVVQLDNEIAIELDFVTGVEQKLLAFKRSRSSLLTTMREELTDHGITPDPHRAATKLPMTTVQRSRAGMPRRQKARLHHSVADTFADRVPESEALRTSVEYQISRLRGDVEIVDGVFPNVLVFHGKGGRGKTGMSKRMEQWVTGDLSGASEWGRGRTPGSSPCVGTSTILEEPSRSGICCSHCADRSRRSSAAGLCSTSRSRATSKLFEGVTATSVCPAPWPTTCCCPCSRWPAGWAWECPTY